MYDRKELNKEGGVVVYTPEDLTSVDTNQTYSAQRSLTARNETARKVLREKLNAATIKITELEDLVGIII